MALGHADHDQADDHHDDAGRRQAGSVPAQSQPTLGLGPAHRPLNSAPYHVRPDERPATASSTPRNHGLARSWPQTLVGPSSSNSSSLALPTHIEVRRAQDGDGEARHLRGEAPASDISSALVPSLAQRLSFPRPFALVSTSPASTAPVTVDSARGAFDLFLSAVQHPTTSVRPTLSTPATAHSNASPGHQGDARTDPTFSVPLSRPPPPSVYHAPAPAPQQSHHAVVDAQYHHRATYGWPYAHPSLYHHQRLPSSGPSSHPTSTPAPVSALGLGPAFAFPLPSTTQAVSSSRRSLSHSSSSGSTHATPAPNSVTATPATRWSVSTAPTTPQLGVKQEGYDNPVGTLRDRQQEEYDEDVEGVGQYHDRQQQPHSPWGASRSPGRMFKCQLDKNCKAEFSRAEHLARHERKHTKEKPFICHCQKAFSRLDNWRQHKNSVHKDETEDNIRTEDRLMQVHKLIQRRNNANKQAYINGEALAISAPPLDHTTLAATAATTGGTTTTVPTMHQPQLAGIMPHHHHPTVTHSPQVNSPYPSVYGGGAVGAAYSSHTASPAIGIASPYTGYESYHDVGGPAGPSYTPLRNSGGPGRGGYVGAGPSSLSHGQYWSSDDPSGSGHASGSQSGGNYGLAETSGRAYVAVSPTQPSGYQQQSGSGSQSGSPYRVYGQEGHPHGGVGSIVGMPPAAFSPGPASQAGRSNPGSQVGDSAPSYYLPNTSGGRPSAGGGNASHSSSSNSIRTVGSHGSPSPMGKSVGLPSISHPASPGPGTSEAEMARHELLRARALAAVMTKPIEELEREAYAHHGDPSALSHRYPGLDATLGSGPSHHSHFDGSQFRSPQPHQGPPSPLRGNMDPPTTIGLAPHAMYGGGLGSPGLEQYGGGPQYSLHPSHDSSMYRLPARPKSSNDMRSAVVLASAVAAAAASGDMATSSSSSTLASNPPASYSVTTPHLGHGSTTPLASLPPSPVVGYLMPPFYHQAGPRHLESPNLPSTPRMESTSGAVGAPGSTMMGSGSSMQGPGGNGTPGSGGRGTPGPSNGKRSRDSTESLFTMSKRVAY